mgnify:CR=1 FL=1
MNINIEQQLKVILGKSLDEASKEEIYIALLKTITTNEKK